MDRFGAVGAVDNQMSAGKTGIEVAALMAEDGGQVGLLGADFTHGIGAQRLQ